MNCVHCRLHRCEQWWAFEGWTLSLLAAFSSCPWFH
jgi:hypothetical protein